MQLRQPTDFLILEALSDGKRNTGANIAVKIGADRGYINAELPQLADYGLVEKVGPHENSGLYQITPLGVAAVEKQPLYDEDQAAFESVIHEFKDEITIRPPEVVGQP